MDTLLLTWMKNWQHPALIAGMSAITWLGSIVVLLPLAIVAGWRLGAERNWQPRAYLPAAVLGGALLAQGLKWIVDRDRPDHYPSLIPMPADASFPSAHSLQITVFVVAWLLRTQGWRHAGQVAAGALLVFAIGFSRLYLQVHFLSDVLFGIIGGLLWVWVLHRLPVWRVA